MSDEKILIVSDSLEGPTGFANNAAGIAWSLAKEYEVHVLGLQSVKDSFIDLNIEGETRSITQHANFPREPNVRWDFGKKSLPVLLDRLEPDLLFTLNDIQMIQHIPQILCPDKISLKIIDLPAKEFLSNDAIRMQLEAEIEKFKEKYPRNQVWVAYCPQDGIPPMYDWKFIYQAADQVVAMSKFGQKVFKDYFNMEVPYIYHGVDSETFKPTEKPEILQDKFIVGDINRNQPRKQPVRAIQAFAKFAKDKDDVYLHLQKDWNDQFGWPLEYFINLYNLRNKVVQPKPVGMPREEVARVYNAWDVNLICTGGEGFGIPFIEAGICGVPSIACDYTTSHELLMEGKPNPRGLLVKHSLYWQLLSVAAVQRSLVDIDDLANALNKYYYNRELLAKHGENAHEWCKRNVTLKKLQHSWLKLIKEVLNKELP